MYTIINHVCADKCTDKTNINTFSAVRHRNARRARASSTIRLRKYKLHKPQFTFGLNHTCTMRSHICPACCTVHIGLGYLYIFVCTRMYYSMHRIFVMHICARTRARPGYSGAERKGGRRWEWVVEAWRLRNCAHRSGECVSSIVVVR